MGWILETNRAMNRGMEAMGGQVVKRYRLYERRFEPDAEPAFPAGLEVWEPQREPVQLNPDGAAASLARRRR